MIKKLLIFTLLLLALAFTGCVYSDEQKDPPPTLTPTHTMSSKYYGSWKYAHSGQELYIVSSTKLDFTEVDDNLLEVNDDGQTKYLIRNGVKNVNTSGNVNSLSVDANAAHSRAYSGVGSVNVVLENVKDENINTTISTDENGRFSDNTLPAGTYEISVNKDGLEARTEVTIDDKNSDLGNFFLIDENSNNFKTELIMEDEFIYADSRSYRTTIRIHNITDIDGIGLSYDVNISDDKLLSLTHSSIVGTIPANKYKDIPLTLSFSPFVLNERNIKINVKLQDINYNVWNDYVTLKVYKKAYKINFKTSQSLIRGYVTLPNNKQKYINAYSNTNMYVPSTIGHDYYIVLSNPDLSRETAYSIGYETSPDSLTGFSDTGAYESINDKYSTAVNIEKNTTVSAYLHVGDIDFYKFSVGESAELFYKETNATLSTKYISNEINITDDIIKFGTLAKVDNGNIVLNGAEVGQSATLELGDKISLSLESSDAFSTNIKTTLTIGVFYASFNVATFDEDTTIDTFDFADVSDANLSTSQTSNPITIAGINTEVKVSLSSGVLIKNDVELDSNSTLAVEGDTIRVKLNSSDLPGTIVSSNLTIGSQTRSYLVGTVISHNSVVYGVVKSPYTQKVWLDRNLGASNVCSSLDDATCYGDYYQWGRNSDGHQESNSTTVSSQATDINNAGTEFRTYSDDWLKDVDNNGSLRSAIWSKTDGTSVCPVGFRVPTIIELEDETINSWVKNNTDSFNDFLKLPSAGNRNYVGGSVVNNALHSFLWSSSINSSFGSYSNSLNIYSTRADSTYYNRATGISVRCVKD